MPRVLVPMIDPSRGGAVMSLAGLTGDTVNNHYTPNNGNTIVAVKNTGATVPRSVTFVTKKKIDPDQTQWDRVEAIPIGETQLFSDFSVDVYGSQLDINVDNVELHLWVIKA